MIKQFFTFSLVASAFLFSSCSSDDATGPIQIIIEGATVAPEVGGPNEPNQVYVDLSSGTSTTVERDSWDLGFYFGSDYRITLNGSIAMAAAELSVTDIDAVNSSSEEVKNLQEEVKVGSFSTSNLKYVDAFTGDLNKTVISKITEASTKVYLVNLGNTVGTDTPATGGVSLNGEARGWKKIRVFKKDNHFVLQYADLDATTHEEITIMKRTDSDFAFFSFDSEDVINVQPASGQWDLNFTAFTDEVFDGSGTSFGAYFYGDFVTTNTEANVGAYVIDTEAQTDLSYEDFKLADVNSGNFIFNDQRAIGSTWRNGGGPNALPSLKDAVFYVIKDADGNLYKLKFIALTNEAGERGYPKFVYSLLQ